MTTKRDVDLVEDFRRGDVEGFNELVRRHQEKIYWVCRRIVGTHEDADDVVQDVFIRVYERLKSFRAESEFYTWLYRIATNASLNALRKKRLKEFVRFDEIYEELLPSDDQTDGPALRQEFRTVLEQAIDRLPPKQKVVFVMRYHDELSYEEMAVILKKSVGGLKANYFHALKKIQEYIQREMSA
jgi:RNA polymerase sigma-70 factor, ECF subfamily